MMVKKTGGSLIPIKIPEMTLPTEDPRDQWKNLKRFNTISLKDWIELCRASPPQKSPPQLDMRLLYDRRSYHRA